MNVKLIHVTPDSEKLIGYMARVSSPNQDNPNIEKLLKYLINNKHWSPFEMCNLCVEVTTSRAIAQQIIRHKSLNFQEFSQRYSKVDIQDIDYHEARMQDVSNRQNSLETAPQETEDWFLQAQVKVVEQAHKLYYEALDKGIAKEVARFLLPLSTNTKLYINGNIRSWIHYLEARTDKSTQKEHREVAEEIKKIFVKQFPVISKALNW